MDAAPQRPGGRLMDLDDFEEYLADKPEHEKWELIGGRVIKLMVGARWTHHRIVQNINFSLTRHFRERGSSCRTYTETFWLKQRFLKLAVFPDVMVHCGPVSPDATSVEDPVALFEVVSPGSADRDHLEKGELYRRLPSLRHYVLVKRDWAQVEILNRADEQAWISPEPIEGLNAAVPLPALGIDLPLAEIYRDVLEG